MTSTDLTVRDHQAIDQAATSDKPVIITGDQIGLIKATIAPDATDAELQLFFYDCRRRGVHPLDKLIHFTKRKGKYTPVTSIDFFRARAASTREHIGTDDVVFTGTPGEDDFAATVTVHRLVQGEKCSFTATARWPEYLPDAGNDFMFRKMPHGQLGKCAEALALRKGFPQELAGLHTVEEMERSSGEQAPPRKTVQRTSDRKPATAAAGLSTDYRKVKDVRPWGKTGGNWSVVLDGDATDYSTKDAALAANLADFKGTDHTICLTYEDNEWGGRTYHNIKTFAVMGAATPTPTAAPLPAAGAPLTSGDIPFSSGGGR